MKITLDLETVALATSQLIVRAAAAADIDPLAQLRSVASDSASIAAIAPAVRGLIAGQLGCYYEEMSCGSRQWTLLLWSPSWTRRTDPEAVKSLLLTAVSATAAALLMEPTPLAGTAIIYMDQARRAITALIALLDRLTAPPLPAPGHVRRQLHPFV